MSDYTFIFALQAIIFMAAVFNALLLPKYYCMATGKAFSEHTYQKIQKILLFAFVCLLIFDDKCVDNYWPKYGHAVVEAPEGLGVKVSCWGSLNVEVPAPAEGRFEYWDINYKSLKATRAEDYGFPFPLHGEVAAKAWRNKNLVGVKCPLKLQPRFYFFQEKNEE